MSLASRPASLVWGLVLSFLCVSATADVSLGPFATPADVAAAERILADRGVTGGARIEEQHQSLGYIVVSEQLGPERGATRVADLKAQGVSDVVYVAVGVYQGRVSAGVYGAEKSAEFRASKLLSVGFPFEVLERTRTTFFEGWFDVTGDVDNRAVADIEKDVGYKLQRVGSADKPVPAQPVVEPAKAAPPKPAESTPKPVELRTPTTEKPERSPAVTPEPEVQAPPQETTLQPSTEPSPKPPTQPRAVVTTPAEPEEGLPFVAIFILAIVISAAAAFAYVRFTRSPVASGVFIGYETQKTAPESGQPDGVTRDELTPLERMAEAILVEEGAGTKALLASVESSGPNAIDLIDDMLHLARVETRSVAFDTMTFDLSAFMRDLADSARDLNGVNLKSQDFDLPLVRADADKIRRIIRSLLTWMREFDDAVPLTLTAQVSTTDVPELEVLIENDFSILEQTDEAELFDASSLEGMRLSIARRLATVLGGQVSVGNRDGGGTIVRLALPVVLAEDDLTLSSGATVAELIAAEQKAREEIESANASINEMRAETESQQKTLRETTLRANDAIEAHEQAEQEAKRSIDRLYEELEEAREAAAAEAEAQTQTIAESQGRVDALQAELEAARAHAAAVSAQRESVEVEGQSHLGELQQKLTEAEERLQRELAARERTESEASGFVGRLKRQIEDLREEMASEAERFEKEQAEAKAEIEGLREELAETRNELADVDGREAEKIAELEERNRQLMIAISDAEQKQLADHQTRTAAEGEGAERRQELELALDAAKADVQREAEARLTAEDAAKRRMSALMTELKRTQRELEASLNKSLHQESDEPDIESLQGALTQAEDELEQEKNARVRAEKDTTAHMDRLMNDLNKARSDVRKEAATRAEIELARDERIDALSAELEDTRRRLITEAAARQRAEERATAAEVQREKRVAEEKQKRAAWVDDSAPKSDTPIKSSMPMNNPILRSMAERFVVRLDEQLESLEEALDEGNALDMLQIANWLKGEAYTLGFRDFTGPVSALEEFLKDRTYTRIPAKIVELKHMAARIELGGEVASMQPTQLEKDTRLQYMLPHNARKAEMMENFIAQLGTQLLELESATGSGKANELQRITRWILKYANAFELKEIVEMTRSFEESVANGERDVPAKLAEFSELYSTIEIIKNT